MSSGFLETTLDGWGCEVRDVGVGFAEDAVLFGRFDAVAAVQGADEPRREVWRCRHGMMQAARGDKGARLGDEIAHGACLDSRFIQVRTDYTLLVLDTSHYISPGVRSGLSPEGNIKIGVENKLSSSYQYK